MLSRFGEEGKARESQHEAIRAKQRELLDEQLRDQGKVLDDGLGVLSRSQRIEFRRRQLKHAYEDNGRSPVNIQRNDAFRSSESMGLSACPFPGSAAVPSFDDGQRATFGRALTEITRTAVNDGEVARKVHQRQELVNALEEQVREREAAKYIATVHNWEAEQHDLEASGLRGAGKSRPTVPVHLVPYILAQEPAVLEGTRYTLFAYGARGGSDPTGGQALYAAPQAGAQHGQRYLPAHAHMTAHDGLRMVDAAPYAGQQAEQFGRANRQGDAEARLERLLQSVGTGQMTSEHAERPVFSLAGADGGGGLRVVDTSADDAQQDRAPSDYDDITSHRKRSGLPSDVSSLTTMVQQLLHEQRELREAISKGAEAGQARANSNRMQVASPVAPSRSRPRRPGSAPHRDANGAHIPDRPESATSQGWRSRGGNGSRAQSRQAQSPVPPHGGPIPHARRPVPAPRIVHEVREAKRPAFGRHAEGVVTAAERREKGEARAQAATERRKAALEAFRDAEAEAKAAKRREIAEQKSLRRALPFHRGAVMAEAENQFRYPDDEEGRGAAQLVSPGKRRGVVAPASGVTTVRQAMPGRRGRAFEDDREQGAAYMSPGMARYGPIARVAPSSPSDRFAHEDGQGAGGQGRGAGGTGAGMQGHAVAHSGSPAVELQAESRFLFPEGPGSPLPADVRGRKVSARTGRPSKSQN